MTLCPTSVDWKGVPGYLEALSSVVERDWSTRGESLAAFSQSACSAMKLLPPLQGLSKTTLIEHVLCSPVVLPRQTQIRGEFAEPSVTLFRSDKFSIEANFWIDSTTAIHQHSFAGAFAVLEGECVHTVWRFVQVEDISRSLLVGKLERQESELLRPGDIRAIEPGHRFVHSLFHITRPAVTIVVRTDSRVLRDPERPFIYLPPGIALDPFSLDETLDKQLEMIDFLRRTSEEQVAAIELLLDRRDLSPDGSVRLLMHAANSGIAARTCRRIAKRCAIDYPQLSSIIEQSTNYLLRQRTLVRLRSRIKDEDGRRLLSLLLLMDDFPGIFSMLEKMEVSDPLHFISEQAWHIICELSENKTGPETGCESKILHLWFKGFGEQASVGILRPLHPDISVENVHAIRSLFLEIPAFGALIHSGISI